MLIGRNFNKLCEKILLVTGEQAVNTAGVKVSVTELAERLDLDRAEARNAFQYLADLDLISVETIGGPFLYGHISLTTKGLLKLKRIRINKSNLYTSILTRFCSSGIQYRYIGCQVLQIQF
ncbi:hypothetical protein BH23BAC3_BH23BAC3_02590 [soil metagenome]